MKGRYFDQDEVYSPLSNAGLKALIGHKIKYVSRRDIDKSGRGYFFPQTAIVRAVKGQQLAFGHPENWQAFDIKELVEVVDLGPASPEELED